MNRYGLLMLIALAGCAPKYLSGSTACSSKSECPSGYFCGSNGTATKVCFEACSTTTACGGGFVCGNDGINTLDVCIDKGSTNCQSGETYYCKSAGLCWTDAVVCSTITNCGTTGAPDYRACSTTNLHPDCNGKCVTSDTGGTGGTSAGGAPGLGGTGAGGAPGLGGSKTDAGVGGVSGAGGKTDAGVGGASGSGGKIDAGAGGGFGSGGAKTDGPVVSSADAGAKDAGLSCTTLATCSSGQQCLGGQCCVPPPAGGECTQLPACGCASGKVCYPSSTTHTMACVAGNNIAEGADCSSGLSCQPGFGCFGETCKRYCTSNSDCPAVAGLQNCLQTTWSDDSTSILGVKVCGRLCDPAHPQSPTAPLLACPAGFNCQTSPTGLSFCFLASPLPAGSTCTTAEDCMPGYYCTVGGACNKYCLANADCPGAQTCKSFSSTSMAGTFSVGYCGT